MTHCWPVYTRAAALVCSCHMDEPIIKLCARESPYNSSCIGCVRFSQETLQDLLYTVKNEFICSHMENLT